MHSLADVFIYDAVRTPRGRGKPTGKLHTQTPLSLVSTLLKELSRRYPRIDQTTDEIILGCCEQFNDQGGNLARSSALEAGYRVTTPGLMVSRFCGSGLDAVNIAAAKLMAGQADAIIAGGVEMLSLVSIFGSGGPMSSDVSFKDAVVQIPQGLSADLIATLHGYSRSDVDALGAASQQRANAAWAQGWFNNSVVPIRNGGKDPVLASDELVRDITHAERQFLVTRLAVAAAPRRVARAERWNGAEPVLWQPDNGGPYRLLTTDEAAALEQAVRGRVL